MAELSAHEPLLLNEITKHGSSKGPALAVCLVKWALKILIWVIFACWVAVIFFYPSELIQDLFHKWIQASEHTVFGVAGSIFLIFSAPILIIAFLAFVCVTAFPREYGLTKSKFPKFRLWTFPVLVDGPFGVVSAAELIGILLFSAYIFWAVSAYAIQISREISFFPLPSKVKSYFVLEVFGLRLGSIGLFCLAFLFLPIARGSILLRLIDIPFEHATKYHVWLGHVTMAIFTLHGLCYVVSWSMQGRLLQELLEWRNIGIANLPGVISLLAGLLMWVTSLHPVRKQYFELFFYTHQLYIVFIIFLALHVGDFIFSFAVGPIFLFLLDRFLRFWQSRTTVDIISASCLPCGAVELVFSKPRSTTQNIIHNLYVTWSNYENVDLYLAVCGGFFCFVIVRELSWLQWHPFSVSSSPLDGKYHLSVLIKVLGEWTRKLRDRISNDQQQPQKGLPFQPLPTLTASVEGPYGHESAYHLNYENLILVAGGIGISPFLAILSDILHRIGDKKPCLPKNILVVWAVKKSKELSLLAAINMDSIHPSFSDKLNLEIQTYVTQESEPPLEEGMVYKSVGCSHFSLTNGNSMSNLVGTGNNIWSGAYVVLSTVGFIILLGMLEVFYIQRFNISSWWYQGLLFFVCMIAGIVIFGGLVIVLWSHWERSVSSQESFEQDDNKSNPTRCNEASMEADACPLSAVSSSTIQYGFRPNFQAIFKSVSEQWGHVDIGVIVCGPPSLQSSVAKECRSQNLRGRWNHAIFHFNSHSFDL